MKKALSVLAISALVMTASSAMAGGPGKKKQQGPGCPEACQQQIDDIQSGQAQQNEQLSSHGRQLENHEGRIKKLEENKALYGPWYARGGLKLAWPSQADYLGNEINGEMGWGFQGAIGKVFPTDFGAFRLEFEYAQQKSDLEDTDDGDVDIQTYMMNGAYELPVADMIGLYATVGAGYGKYDLNAPYMLTPSSNKLAWADHNEGVFAYKAGTGVTFNISEEMAVDLGYEYLGTSHAVIGGAEVNKIGSHNVVSSFRFMF